VKKILVIDDEKLDLFISKKLLSLEYQVEGFTTINEALQWASENSFDVALIDYYLGPNLYAHTVLKDLLAAKGPAFKAIVLSNFVDDKQIRELKDSGFAEIIYKPLTLEKFKSVIEGS
jgi:DNA-binding NtrC family response regulator